MLNALSKGGYMRVSFWKFNLIYFIQFYWVLLLGNMEFMNHPMDEGKFLCCFSIRSLPSTIPWTCARQTIHHHALGHSQARVTESDSDHHNPESGEAFTECLRMSSLNCRQEAAQWPSPANRPLSHFPGAYSVWIISLRAVHWETGQRLSQVPETQRISLVPTETCRWHSRCLILAQRFVRVPFRRRKLNFRSFTSLLLANNYKYFLINVLPDL